MVLSRILPSLAVAAALCAPALAGDTTLLAGSGFGPFRRIPSTGFGSLEVNHAWTGTPWAAWAAVDAARAGTYVGLGPMVRWQAGKRLTLALGSGPGWFSNDGSADLGSRLEFRSTGYLAYRMPKGWEAVLAVSHYSNGGTQFHNPGAETVRFMVAVPL